MFTIAIPINNVVYPTAKVIQKCTTLFMFVYIIFKILAHTFIFHFKILFIFFIINIMSNVFSDDDSLLEQPLFMRIQSQIKSSSESIKIQACLSLIHI